MNIFEQTKNRLNISDVVNYYGVQLNRSNFACCPFHAERTASFKVYPNAYKCFGCGASGDAISFVMKLFSLTGINAVKKLNTDFSLNLPFETYQSAPKLDRTNVLKFEAWEQWACNTVAEYLKQLDEWKRNYAPKTTDDNLHPLFAEALNKIEYWDHIYKTVFIEGDFTIKTEFYQTHRKAVDALDTTRKVRSA